MKVIVLRAYKDKQTDEFHKIGSEPYEIKDKARAEVLIKEGFVSEFVENKTADLKAEVEALKKENTALNAKVAELTAIIEKAAAK